MDALPESRHGRCLGVVCISAIVIQGDESIDPLTQRGYKRPGAFGPLIPSRHMASVARAGVGMRACVGAYGREEGRGALLG